MAFDIVPNLYTGGQSSAGSDWGLASVWDAAVGINANPSYAQPRNAGTATTNAMQTMQPITADNGGGWTGFWQGLVQNVVGYSIAKDAVQSGVQRPAVYQPGTAQPGQQYAQAQVGYAGGGLMQLLIIGGVIFAAVKLAK